MSAPAIARVLRDLEDVAEMIRHDETCGTWIPGEDRVRWCLACQYRAAYDSAHSPAGMGIDGIGRSAIAQGDPTAQTVIARGGLIRACHDAAKQIEDASRGLLNAVNRLESALDRSDPRHRRPPVRYPPGRDVTVAGLEEARQAQLRRRLEEERQARQRR